jgi:hypothetical protein
MQKATMHKDIGLCIRQIKQLGQSTGLVKCGSVEVVSETVKEMPSLQWNETKTSPVEIKINRSTLYMQKKNPTICTTLTKHTININHSCIHRLVSYFFYYFHVLTVHLVQFIIQTNKCTTYTDIDNILYIVCTPTCFNASASSSGSTNIVLC